MKHLLLTMLFIVAGLCFATSCEEKKSEPVLSQEAIVAMIDEAAEKKAAKMEKKRQAQQLREEAEEAEEDARVAREEAAAAREEAAAAREEARRARVEANNVRTQPRVRATANIPGARRAHVIREGGYTNARSGPGVGYSIMNKVKDGSPILYTGNLGYAWVEVYTLDGRYLGYMSSNKVIPEQ